MVFDIFSGLEELMIKDCLSNVPCLVIADATLRLDNHQLQVAKGGPFLGSDSDKPMNKVG